MNLYANEKLTGFGVAKPELGCGLISSVIGPLFVEQSGLQILVIPLRNVMTMLI